MLCTPVMYIRRTFCFTLLLSLMTPISNALTLPMPAAGDDVIGTVAYGRVLQGENLADVSRRFNMGA